MIAAQRLSRHHGSQVPAAAQCSLLSLMVLARVQFGNSRLLATRQDGFFLRNIQLACTGCLSLLPTGATGRASSAFLQAWRYRCSMSEAASVCTGRYSRAGQAQRSLEGSASLWIQGRNRCLSQGCQIRNHTSSQSLGCLDRRPSARPCALRGQSRRTPSHAAICQRCFGAVARCSGCLDQS